MKVLARVDELRAERPSWGAVGLVPTMGYLHDGHLSLIRAARARSETVVMSLFVNPAQFGPSEDLATYPRDIPRDLALAEGTGVDVVFMPGVDEVYPPRFDTWVDVGAVTRRWEGERRPGHFRGVATVVMKLLQMVQPASAYFGEKDFQQLAVVTAMVRDLNVPVDIVPCPTIREPSGLALSSRNAYLSAEARARAAVLYRAIRHGQARAAAGDVDIASLTAEMERVVASEPAAQLDYLAVIDPDSFEPIARLEAEARIVAAMHVEGVRLIDNAAVTPGTAASDQK